MIQYRFEPLADGVYAAISQNRTAVSNSGIIDLGDRTVVFDTSQSFNAAQELREAALELTGRVPEIVINSHEHLDHIAGNRLFPEATILSTAKTRDRLVTHGKAQIDHYKMMWRRIQKNLRKQGSNPFDMADCEEVLGVLEELELVLPSVTFDTSLTLHGTKRTAELHTFGGGHTTSDAMLYLPEEGILFCGDLVVIGGNPWLGNSQPQEWVEILEKAQAWPIRTAVPGHGPVGTADDVAWLKDYIQALLDLAATGKPLEEARVTDLPDRFHSVQAGGFAINYNHVLQQR